MNSSADFKIAEYVAKRISKKYELFNDYKITDEDDWACVDFAQVEIRKNLIAILGIQTGTNNEDGPKVVITTDFKVAPYRWITSYEAEEFDIRDPDFIDKIFKFIDKTLNDQI